MKVCELIEYLKKQEPLADVKINLIVDEHNIKVDIRNDINHISTDTNPRYEKTCLIIVKSGGEI